MMTAKKLIDVTQDQERIAAYLAQCRVVSLHENETHVPPTGEETTGLIRHLRAAGSNPLVIGSVGVLNYLRHVDPKLGFRPTVDLDLWVDSLPESRPHGWTIDLESIGVPSWVSPSGGHVDFLLPGQDMPSGTKTPSRLDPDPASAGSDFPVASWTSLLKLKLNSVREKDFADSIALVRAQGYVPTPQELGQMTRAQRENYEMLVQWFNIRPHGNYGE